MGVDKYWSSEFHIRGKRKERASTCYYGKGKKGNLVKKKQGMVGTPLQRRTNRVAFGKVRERQSSL